MEEANTSLETREIINREAPQLVAVLKELKDGLDKVRAKVDELTAKAKSGNFPREEGISYLEAKHLLLLNYCQSLVYYVLLKAKGLSVQEHPVVRSLVEIRLFLEKIRPIDKKLEYQIKKLTGASVTRNAAEDPESVEKETDPTNNNLLKYRPNPDLLVPKTNATQGDLVGVYRPPKFAPAAMGEDKMSREERNALRKEKETMRQARQSDYVRELINELDGRPEEHRENFGSESREHKKIEEKVKRRTAIEEELFTRAPITKAEKKQMRSLKKSRNGLLGLTESFYDEIRTLPFEEDVSKASPGFDSRANKGNKSKRRRRNH